jgi:uncharacterized delta-60 repeat protein
MQANFERNRTMTLFRWISTAFSPARKRPPRVRLNLERLEDRLTPTAGLLDPTFGAGAGYVLGSSSNPDGANAIAVQSDGKIVTAGTSANNFLITRYNADGSLDTSFGSGGYTTTLFNRSTTDMAEAVAIQSDGKILAGGEGATKQGATYFALARYNPNGTLDTTFGSNGEVQTTLAGSIWSIAVQADGKILVAGAITSGDAALVRYNANGTLDTTFGNGGELVTNIRPYSTAHADSLVIQPDGKIVLACASYDPTIGFVAARFNADGTTDSSFGSGGEVSTHVGSQGDTFGGVALQADGKIVVTGSVDSGSGHLGLVRYNADGTLDTTFGPSGNGIDIVPLPSGYSEAGGGGGVEVQSDGKIVASGEPGPPGGVWSAVRVNSDGTLDTSYGNGGWATTVIGYADDVAASALQPDGRLLLAGWERPTSSGTPRYAVLVRFTGDTTAASFSVTGFPSSVTAGTPETITVTALNPDGSVNTGYTGTAHFTSSDPQAVLPADYTFTAADQGVHTFSATLVTAGSQFLTVTDTTTSTMLGGEAGIQVNPAAASQVILSAPSSARHGTAFSLTLTVEDAYGNVVTGYVGTVHFTSSDSTATLPADYTFTAADAGVHTFSNLAILRKRGTQTVTVTDTQNSALTATDSVNVT